VLATLTPKAIVAALDEHIIGQADAKRALFKEAAYLGIRPDAYQGSSSAA